MGYRLNRLDEPVFMAVSKPLLTEFGIHYKLESCDLCLHNCNVILCNGHLLFNLGTLFTLKFF